MKAHPAKIIRQKTAGQAAGKPHTSQFTRL